MANDTFRSVSLRRTEAQHYVATNVRGGELPIGPGDDQTFTPVELLLAAIAGCSAIDVDILTSRRAEPDQFDVEATGDKIRDDDGNRMTNLELTFRIRFPEGEAGDAARALLPDAVAKSHDRLCTVSRTVELGSPIKPVIE
jgi:uncharacterized OsmC-like protein